MKRLGALLVALGLALMSLALVTAGPAVATDSNQPDYWETLPGEVCEKVDDTGAESGGYTVPAEPEDWDWSKLVVKAGSGDDENTVITDPVAGQTYNHSVKDGYSHIILCKVPEDTPETETPTPTPTETVTITPSETPTVTETPSETITTTPTESESETPPVTETETPTALPTESTASPRGGPPTLVDAGVTGTLPETGGPSNGLLIGAAGLILLGIALAVAGLPRGRYQV